MDEILYVEVTIVFAKHACMYKFDMFLIYTPEKTKICHNEIRKIFNSNITPVIMNLTKQKKESFGNHSYIITVY